VLLPAPPPLRTVHAPFNAYGSSIGQRTPIERWARSTHPGRAVAGYLAAARDSLPREHPCAPSAARGRPDSPGTASTLLRCGQQATCAAKARWVEGSCTSMAVAACRPFCLASSSGLSTVHVRQHPREVSSLACAVMYPECQASTAIRPITGRPSLAPSSFARSPIRRSYDLPTDVSPRGRATGLPRSARLPARVRSCLDAGGAPSAGEEFGAPPPAHLPFGPSVSASFRLSYVTALTALHLG
jgi:hypothetical protein